MFYRRKSDGKIFSYIELREHYNKTIISIDGLTFEKWLNKKIKRGTFEKENTDKNKKAKILSEMIITKNIL